MNRSSALAELVATFADPALLRVIDRRSQTPPDLVPATFAMEHGAVVALALGGIFRDGLVVVEHDGEAIALHAACGTTFFDPYGLHTRDELLAGWADFYGEPTGAFVLRPSTDADSATFEIDLAVGRQAVALRDALFERCGTAIAVLQG